MKTEAITLSNEELRRLQLVQLQILKEFDKVCRENDIKYILDAGTLLGAVRHKGFIPWDDDIDVRMLRSEYEKFREIACKDFSDTIYFQDYRNEKAYPWLYSKVRMYGTRAVRVGQEHLGMRDGIFIDIFPCDGIPADEKAFKKKCVKAQLCRRTLYARTARVTATNILEKIKWNLVCLIPRTLVYSVIEGLVEKHPADSADKVGCLGWHAPKDVNGFDKKWFTELEDIGFEGEMFMAPKDYDGFLRFSFGDDYMTPPKEEDRGTTAPLSYLSFEE